MEKYSTEGYFDSVQNVLKDDLSLFESEIQKEYDFYSFDLKFYQERAAAIRANLAEFKDGMKVRLAFAVAAFLEPEILIVDEVLAVGDAEFQKKAIGKMQDVSKSEGRTVLFVSHNMLAIESLCDRVVLLKNGVIDSIGDASTKKAIWTALKHKA